MIAKGSQLLEPLPFNSALLSRPRKMSARNRSDCARQTRIMMMPFTTWVYSVGTLRRRIVVVKA